MINWLGQLKGLSTLKKKKERNLPPQIPLQTGDNIAQLWKMRGFPSGDFEKTIVFCQKKKDKLSLYEPLAIYSSLFLLVD